MLDREAWNVSAPSGEQSRDLVLVFLGADCGVVFIPRDNWHGSAPAL